MSYVHAHNLLGEQKGPARLDIFDPAVRDDMTLRNALASRDIPQVYRLCVKLAMTPPAPLTDHCANRVIRRFSAVAIISVLCRPALGFCYDCYIKMGRLKDRGGHNAYDQPPRTAKQ